MSKRSWRGWRLESGLWREEKTVSLADRGFRYGMSLFETIAIRNGSTLFLEPHLSRIFSSAKHVEWNVPESWRQEISQFFLSEKLTDGVARIYITAGEGGPFETPADFNLYVMWEDVAFPDQEAITSGIKVAVMEAAGDSLFAGLKTGNYWSPVLTLQEARKTGADEALIFNSQGSLISAAMANVFVLLDGKWVTPLLKTGARRGVIREWVLQREDATEGDVGLEEMKRVSEIVLVNSRIGVMPVNTVGDVAIFKRPQSLRLAEAYLNTVINA